MRMKLRFRVYRFAIGLVICRCGLPFLNRIDGSAVSLNLRTLAHDHAEKFAHDGMTERPRPPSHLRNGVVVCVVVVKRAAAAVRCLGAPRTRLDAIFGAERDHQQKQQQQRHNPFNIL